ncbi:MAG: hypothetical protein R3Y56_03075 [Akkermansia sp.]
MTHTLTLPHCSYRELKTYALAALFVAGNLIAPQLAHLLPQGGLILLPIYFFTLIAAYHYGWRVGLLTAILSPLLNHALFGMPSAVVLPAILCKSLLLVGAATLVARHFKRITLPLLALVVLGYQVIGTLVEWALLGSFQAAIQDFRLGLVGMLVQIVGGYLLLTLLNRKA